MRSKLELRDHKHLRSQPERRPKPACAEREAFYAVEGRYFSTCSVSIARSAFLLRPFCHASSIHRCKNRLNRTAFY